MITLHHVPGSRSMRTLWLLVELDVPFAVNAHVFDASLAQSDYTTLHPAGRVPSLEMDGDVLWESGAIAEVLCERFPDRGLGSRQGEPDRPDWLVWLHFAETVSQSVGVLNDQVLMTAPPDRCAATIMRETARLHRCYAAIEARLSTPMENRDYLLTCGFSAADIGVGQAVWMAQHFVPFAETPEAEAWFARITERPSFAASVPAPGDGLYDRPFYDLAALDVPPAAGARVDAGPPAA